MAALKIYIILLGLQGYLLKHLKNFIFDYCKKLMFNSSCYSQFLNIPMTFMLFVVFFFFFSFRPFPLVRVGHSVSSFSTSFCLQHPSPSHQLLKIFRQFVVKLTKTYVCYWEYKSPFLRNICATGKIKVHLRISFFLGIKYCLWLKMIRSTGCTNQSCVLVERQITTDHNSYVTFYFCLHT